ERWQRALEAARDGGFDEAAQARALDRARRLCVGMEILAGVESPPDEAALRMEVQVERLHRGLAAGEADAAAPAEAVRALELEWLANGPMPAGARPDLEERFSSAREAALREVSAA
ncbi:hypothetical protein H0Z60_08840, partial [Ectothiorhodospiraceae bacterium WFHF3C12]|nr:hypothetical protein [Ectothiorhodospiraceae bacterium WFHF3C12]